VGNVNSAVTESILSAISDQGILRSYKAKQRCSRHQALVRLVGQTNAHLATEILNLDGVALKYHCEAAVADSEIAWVHLVGQPDKTGVQADAYNPNSDGRIALYVMERSLTVVLRVMVQDMNVRPFPGQPAVWVSVKKTARGYGDEYPRRKNDYPQGVPAR
jgi:hypothetical protein